MVRKHFATACYCLFVTLWPRLAQPQTISTIAGNGLQGFSGDHGVATAAQLNYPAGITVDSKGNLYIADTFNNRIRQVTSDGIIRTLAGSNDAGFSGDGGWAIGAKLYRPGQVGIDSVGNVYIPDSTNHRVRKVSPSGWIDTIAGSGSPGFSGDGGPAILAQLNGPAGVISDWSGNLYVADTWNHRVRYLTAAGLITTFAGSGGPTFNGGFAGDGGPATAAQLSAPSNVAIDATGNVYIADWSNHRIRRVSAADKTISTVAGSGVTGTFAGDGGPATSAKLNQPNGVAVDAAGNIYIADTFNHRVRKVTPWGVITTIAGTGSPGFAGDNGPATSAQLNFPASVALDVAGNLYIADQGNHRIRRIQLASSPSPSGPQIIFVSPGEGFSGTAELELTVTGIGFQPGSVLSFSGTGITVKSYLWRTPTQLVAEIELQNAYLGPQDVIVTNPDLRQSVLSSGFTVQSPPAVDSLMHPQPGSLSFYYLSGAPLPASQNVLLSAAPPLDYTAWVSSGGWLRITPVSGSSLQPLTISVDPRGLGPGEYDGTVWVRPEYGDSFPIQVHLTVNMRPPVPTGNVQTIIPHSAYGGGFVSRQIITNLANANNTLTLNRISQSGLLIDSRPVVLPPHATFLLADTEDKRTARSAVEWFAIGSEQPVAASTLFDSRPAGILPSAVGVLAAPPLSSFTLPVRYAPQTTIGIALVNPNSSPNVITLKLIDQNGNYAARDSITMSPFSQIAFSLDTRDAFKRMLTGFNEFSGILAVTTAGDSQPVAAMVVGFQNGLFYSLPVGESPAASVASGGPIPYGKLQTIIPHSAYGGGFVSRQTITNLANVNNTLTINRISQSGLVVGSRNITLPPYATFVLADSEDRRAASSAVEWFAIASEQPIAASILFDSRPVGIFPSAVGALASPPLTSFVAPVRYAPLTTIGLALANLHASPNPISLKLINQNGTNVAEDSLTLAPFSQVAFALDTRNAFRSVLTSPAEFVGVLVVTTAGANQPVAAMAVGYQNGLFYSLPVTSTTGIAEPVSTVTATIGTSGGSLAVTDATSPLHGFTIEVPPGALDTTFQLKISLTDATDIPGITLPGKAIRFEPEGLSFRFPVAITIPYADANNDGIVDGTRVDESGLEFVVREANSEDIHYSSVVGRDPQGNTITVELNAFSTGQFAEKFFPYPTRADSPTIMYYWIEPKPLLPNALLFQKAGTVAQLSDANMNAAVRSALTMWEQQIGCRLQFREADASVTSRDQFVQFLRAHGDAFSGPAQTSDKGLIVTSTPKQYAGEFTLPQISSVRIKQVDLNDSPDSYTTVHPDGFRYGWRTRQDEVTTENSPWQTETTGDTKLNDLQTVLGHEIGHALGLSHEITWNTVICSFLTQIEYNQPYGTDLAKRLPMCVMFPLMDTVIVPGITARSLTGHPDMAADIQRIRNEYGIPAEGCAPGPQEPIPISIGQTVTGTLSSVSRRATGCPGCYADLYEFTLTSPPPPGSDVAILLESASFDAYLRLLDTTGRELAADDNTGFGTNALIRYFTGPGTYRIEVSSRVAGTGGGYRLTLRLSQPFFGNLEADQTRSGTLTLWSEVSSYCKGCFRDVWDFGVGASQSAIVKMTSAAFAPYLKVWLWDWGRQQFQLVAENGNPGGGATAQATLPGGTYRMETTSARPGIGPYSLSLQTVVVPQIALSGQIRDEWGNAFPGASVIFSDGHRVTTGEDGKYAVTLQPGFSGTATPTMAGFWFQPANRTYSNLTGNRSGDDYSGRSATDYPVFFLGDVPGACNKPSPVTKFSASPVQIGAWIPLTNVQVGDTVRWDWYGPNQARLRSDTLTVNFAGSGCAWAWYSFPDRVGTWRAESWLNGNLSHANTFLVTAPGPLVGISPSSGVAGTRFDYQGSGFTTNSAVTSHLRKPDRTEFPTLQISTNNAGQFTHTIDSTGFSPGSYDAWATDNRTGVASNTISFTIAITPSTKGKVYVNNFGSNTVSVIDVAQNAVAGTIAVGTGPGPVRLTPNAAKAYVGNYKGSTLSVVSTATDSVLRTITVGSGPCNIVVTPNGAKAYATVSGTNSVSVIDVAADTVIKTIPVGNQPCPIAMSPTGLKVLVANGASNSLSVIDTVNDAVTTTIPVGSSPYAIAFTPTGSKAYVANIASSSVSVIDTVREVELQRIPVRAGPSDVAIKPDGTKIYVPNSTFSFSLGSVTVIDATNDTVTKTISIPGFNASVVSWKPDGSKAYVAHTGSPYALGDISVIDGETDLITKSFAVQTSPVGIAFAKDGSKAFVLNNGSGSVSIIDAGSDNVTKTVTVGSQPVDMAVVPAPQ